MTETCEQSSEYAAIADEVIRNTPSLNWILEEDISIGYLVSDFPKKSNGKIVFGTCRKIPDRDRWAIPYDFVITVYEPNVDGWTEEQKRILMHHELLHIGMGNGQAKYKTVPHDIEEFREIIDKYGIDWSD